MNELENTSNNNSLLDRISASIGTRFRTSNEQGEPPQQRGLVIAMCITCSLLLWGFSSMSEVYTKTIEVDTRIENMSANEAFVTLPPNTVQLQVEGEGLSLLQLYYNRPDIIIDANNSDINFIDAVSRSISSNLSIKRVSPLVFNLQKEEKVIKKVPVELRADIATPKTHELVLEPSIFPDSVEISGAPSILNEINTWPTIDYDATDIKDTLAVDIPLVDSLQGLVELPVQSTQLYVVVEEFTEGAREIEVMINDVQDYVTLDPPVVEVTYRIPLSQFKAAQSARDFFLTVSYDDIKDDTTGFIQPHLELPEGLLIRDVNINPGKLRYYDVLVDE